MTRRALWLCGLLGVLVLAAALAWPARTRSPGDGAGGRAAPARDDGVAAIDGRLRALDHEVERLRREQAALGGRFTSSAGNSDPAKPTGPAGPADPAEHPVRERAAAPPAPEEPPRAESELLTELSVHLGRRVGEERRDPGWSSQAEARLARAVASEPLAGSHLAAAQCQTTLCRAEIAHADAAAQERFLDGIAATLPPGAQGFAHKVDDDAGPPRTVLYVAREGHPLPAPLSESP